MMVPHGLHFLRQILAGPTDLHAVAGADGGSQDALTCSTRRDGQSMVIEFAFSFHSRVTILSAFYALCKKMMRHVPWPLFG